MDISDSEEGGENEHPDTRLNGRFQQMLQQQSHLGIGETQNAVDFRSQKRKDNSDLYRYIYKTREDGRVIDRRTGELIPGYSYDDTLIDTAIGADQLMEQNSDCQFAAETAGYANLPTTAFTNPGTPRRFQMLEKNLRDVLIEDRKRRAVSIATRGELITGLEEQQHELYTLSQRLSAMYLSMAPTVKRWYWLGSMTGTEHTP
jgi:hypothetical protein